MCELCDSILPTEGKSSHHLPPYTLPMEAQKLSKGSLNGVVTQPPAWRAAAQHIRAVPAGNQLGHLSWYMGGRLSPSPRLYPASALHVVVVGERTRRRGRSRRRARRCHFVCNLGGEIEDILLGGVFVEASHHLVALVSQADDTNRHHEFALEPDYRARRYVKALLCQCGRSGAIASSKASTLRHVAMKGIRKYVILRHHH